MLANEAGRVLPSSHFQVLSFHSTMESPHTIGRWAKVGLIVAGALVGGAAVELWRSRSVPAPAAAEVDRQTAADLERLMQVVPSQSHAMADVAYHWSNLWFAAEQQNWPLAEFYFNEARSHMQWTIFIRPIRKDAQNKDVDLQAIFDALDVTSFAAVKIALAKQDSQQFAAAYKLALDGCYSCHKASAKPFLRVGMPSAPAQTIIQFAPGQ
jgi:hypothetical protein